MCCSMFDGSLVITLPVQAKEARANGQQGYQFIVDKDDVATRVGDLLKRQDLSKYVL